MIVIYFILCLLMGHFGSQRRIGFLGGFLLSLILSPIIGAIFIFTSKTLENAKNEQQALALQKQQAQALAEMRNAQQQQGQPSTADELRKLAALKAEGVITEADFEAQKAKLLNPAQ